MKEFLNKNLVSLIIVALLVVVYFQRCGGGNSPIVPINTHDTTEIVIHHYHDSTIFSKPTIINRIYPTEKDSVPTVPSGASAELITALYDSLARVHYTKNVAKDRLQISSGDTIYATVDVTDTIQRNEIIGRRWDYRLDIPEKITTITHTIYSPQKRQLYFGGGILGNQNQFIAGGEIGLFYKDRRDRVFKIGAQKLLNQPTTYGLSSYWKIHLWK